MELAWAAVGWALGIALNAVALELPRVHRLGTWPRCAVCTRRLPLGALTTLPLGGCCSTCGWRPMSPLRSLEGPAALVFGTLAWRYGGGPLLVAYSLYAAVLLLVLAIDLQHRWVYAVVCYPAVLLAVLLSGVVHGSPWAGLAGALLGFAVFSIVYWAGRLVYRGVEPMGSGDITIATLIGAMVGPQRALAALVLGSVLMGAVALALLATRRASRHTFVPFGAGLCLGALVALYLPEGS
ncbi:MAG TPA: A24 family peptidase [Chloroflexota bacterium]|nr:A24 family peptidase [Chloroflexota bacterium]